jgi:hypothetical protein
MFYNRIGGVMVSLLASSVVDRGFEPRLGQAKVKFSMIGKEKGDLLIHVTA